MIEDLTADVTHRAAWTDRLSMDPPEAQPFRWTYDQADPGLMLFTAAIERFGMKFRRGAKILELGCSETDWLERMVRTQQDFELVGVDTRVESHRVQDGFTLRQGSAMDADLFQPESFDWVVMLGALEHFGLGYYGDPVNPNGDTETMANVQNWLKPGGFVYFDVPCQPNYRVAENRHFRMYSPASLGFRLIGPSVDFDGTPYPHGLKEINRAYSLPEPNAGTWCHEPTVDRVPYWYCAVLAQKVAC